MLTSVVYLRSILDLHKTEADIVSKTSALTQKKKKKTIEDNKQYAGCSTTAYLKTGT